MISRVNQHIATIISNTSKYDNKFASIENTNEGWFPIIVGQMQYVVIYTYVVHFRC